MFGHLKRSLGLRLLKLRDLLGAAEEFTMAAAAYNLQLLARQAANLICGASPGVRRHQPSATPISRRPFAMVLVFVTAGCR